MESYKEKILDFYERHKRMPGYKEIMQLCGFKSKNSVYKLLNKLADEGVIEKDAEGRITPLGFGEFKVLGTVQAGFPTAAEEDFSATMSLDEYIVGKNKKSHYILTVSGDSMKDASIAEGDLIVVEKTENAKVDDIVVACVDGDWTLKYLKKEKSGYFLEPANQSYQNIYPENELTIGGVVRGVIRKY